MYEYKLETHLNTLCAQHQRYINLNSTWTLNKRTCSDLLKSVVIRYPHFSMHDASHAEAVISKMEMLLGSRIQKLSPTDTWLLLHAAYAHDLGMVVQWSAIEAVWKQDAFQHYLVSLEPSSDPDLRDAAAFVRQTHEAGTDRAWPLKAYRYVSLINANYFRTQHAQMSKNCIFSPDPAFHLDLGHNGLIQPRLIRLLGEICALHTEAAESVLELDEQTNGYDSDYAHPRFVAMLLRLGDLLDIDNGRFNAGAELSFGGLPVTSIPHKEKHNATTQLLVTPSEIRFRSDCPNSQAYLEARRFVTWLETEVDFLTKYWSKIAPQDLGGYAPCFDCKELLINGVQDIEGVAGLKFEISQDKAFQIIEGSNLYEDRFVFIREVIQNALDTSKLQLWNDLTSGVYQAWMNPAGAEVLQPYDLDQKIYENYPIQVRLTTLTDGRVQVEVTDRGTGISVEAFKRMCNVGVSNAGSEQIQKTIEGMPRWLRPTAGFGIGLQSIFLLTDHFEVDTSTGLETFHAVVHSKRAGGYLQLQRSERQLPRGTTIRIQFKMPENFRFALGGETDEYLGCRLDPISSDNYTGEVRVLEAIHKDCRDSLFPIRATCEKAPTPPLDVDNHLPEVQESWDKWKDQYAYQLSQAADRIQIWDMKHAAYGEFCFVHPRFNGSRFRFKGMEVSKQTPYFNIRGVSALFDVYGLDTKDTITLDRSSFTAKGRRAVAELFHSCLDACIEMVLSHLEKRVTVSGETYCIEGKFNPYVFWRMCSPGQRMRIPPAVLEKINDMAVVVAKDEQGKFVQTTVPVTQLIAHIAEETFVNVETFERHDINQSTDYQQICRLLDRAEGLNIDRVIADQILKSEVSHNFLRSVRRPVEHEPLLLYMLSAERYTLIDVEGSTKESLLMGLSGPISGMNYSFHLSKEQRPKRYAIPALSDYRALAVERTPYGIAEPTGVCSYLILAPFNREEEERRPGLSKEQFLEVVLSSPVFPEVVNYVMEHSIQRNAITEKEVTEQYRKLIGDYYDVMQKVEEASK